MPKGTSLQFQFHEFTDSDTGARVTRLTPKDVVCHRNYFYQKCFTADGSKLLFGGWFEGAANAYLLDLQTGVARQLTEGKGNNTFGHFLSPDDKYLFYVKNRNNVQRVELTTLEETTCFTVPEGWRGAGTWVPNSTCTKLAAMLIRAEDLAAGTGWQKFRAQYLMNPVCRLISIDLAQGTSSSVLEQRVWMGHPMYRPFDNHTMGFCHEGPHDLVAARMWLVDEDGSNLRKVKANEPGESCMHEFWVPDGSRMIYVSYKKGAQNRWICAADPVTLQNEAIMPMPPCSHLMSNYDGSLLVGDGAGHLDDIDDKEGHAFEPDPFLYLFDMKTRTAQRIAAHNSSWGELNGSHQITHPHPSFTPDEKRVLFTSDFEGLPALYLADLPK